MANARISLSEAKKLPYVVLNRLLLKLRKSLKEDSVVKEMFKEYDVDLDEIDYIPMMFGDIDVSAKTNHGLIIFNYKLLTDGDFSKDYSYGVHELTHWLQQTTGTQPTQGADDGNYLDNPDEQEGFQNQISYLAEQFGEDEAETYVDHLLQHHDVSHDGKKKDILMSKV